MIAALRALLRDDGGVSMAEYALIAAALALPMLLAGYALVEAAGNTMTSTASRLTNLGIDPP